MVDVNKKIEDDTRAEKAETEKAEKESALKQIFDTFFGELDVNDPEVIPYMDEVLTKGVDAYVHAYMMKRAQSISNDLNVDRFMDIYGLGFMPIGGIDKIQVPLSRLVDVHDSFIPNRYFKYKKELFVGTKYNLGNDLVALPPIVEENWDRLFNEDWNENKLKDKELIHAGYSFGKHMIDVSMMSFLSKISGGENRFAEAGERLLRYFMQSVDQPENARNYILALVRNDNGFDLQVIERRYSHGMGKYGQIISAAPLIYTPKKMHSLLINATKRAPVEVIGDIDERCSENPVAFKIKGVKPNNAISFAEYAAKVTYNNK